MTTTRGRLPIRVVAVDDHAVVLAGVLALIERADDLVVVGTAGDVDTAIELIERESPTVVVTDVQIGDESGLTLLDRFPNGPPIVLLTSFEHPSYYQSAFERGAAGYLLKNAIVTRLVDTIRTVAAGGIVFPDGALLAMRRNSQVTPSRRELEVIHLVAEGASNDQIADRLRISAKTVDSHLRTLFDRYNVPSRTGLAMHAVGEGWLRAASKGDGPGGGTPRSRWLVDEGLVRRRRPEAR